jgi:hypothetical protein
MLFGNVFDAVARVAGIAVRRRDKTTNFIGPGSRSSKHPVFEFNDLTDNEPVSHRTIPFAVCEPAASSTEVSSSL